MSRIRSVHPGVWTDERFVTVTPMARLFFMGIWNECDDFGSFEWSPLKLKMRLLPADAVDAAALLAELEDAGSVLRYEVAGKAYGAVRNFCQYQRPKKPNAVHPQTDEVRNWVNTEARSTRDGGEEVPNESGTGGEKSRQMKEEGGRKESKGEHKCSHGNGAAVPEPELTPEDVVEAWNEMAARIGRPIIRKMTDTRRRQLKARIKQNGLDDFKAAFDAIERSPFLRGETGNWPGATFDFLLQPGSFVKMVEGAYDQ